VQLTCPACGAKTSLEAMTEDASARRVAALFGELSPEIARVLPGYLALFRPAKTGLRWSRVARILDELVPIVGDGFTRGGRRRKGSAGQWAQALHEVCGRDLRRPLKSHGYLLEVVAGLADHSEAVAETAYHDALRAGKRPVRQQQDAPVDRVAEAIAAVQHRFAAGYLDASQRDDEIAAIRGGSDNAG